MRKVSVRITLVVNLLLAAGMIAVPGGKASQSRDAEKREARRLWNAVIEEKGGHERLHRIENLLVSDFFSEKRDRMYGKIGEVDLFVFPNRYWKWSYAGPYPHPFMVFCKLESPVHVFITEEGIKTAPGNGQDYIHQSILWLLETKWFQPEPIKVTRARIEHQLVDIIETVFRGERLDFTVDAESLMVLRVSRYGKLEEKASKPWREEAFKDYAAIDGIQMPQKYGLIDSGKVTFWYTPQFSFNVSYDPHFFDTPPPLSAGLDAWKPKSQQEN